MSDLISRQAVMDATKTVMKDVLDSLPTRLVDGEEIYDVRTSELDLILGINKALQNAIKALPSASKSGHWIHDTHYGLNLPEHKCSECGAWEYSDEESNLCPNCGAGYDEEEFEEPNYYDPALWE